MRIFGHEMSSLSSPKTSLCLIRFSTGVPFNKPNVVLTSKIQVHSKIAEHVKQIYCVYHHFILKNTFVFRVNYFTHFWEQEDDFSSGFANCFAMKNLSLDWKLANNTRFVSHIFAHPLFKVFDIKTILICFSNPIISHFQPQELRFYCCSFTFN